MVQGCLILMPFPLFSLTSGWRQGRGAKGPEGKGREALFLGQGRRPLEAPRDGSGSTLPPRHLEVMQSKAVKTLKGVAQGRKVHGKLCVNL